MDLLMIWTVVDGLESQNTRAEGQLSPTFLPCVHQLELFCDVRPARGPRQAGVRCT